MRPEEELIRYTSVKNPQWLDIAHQAVVCTVQFEHRSTAEDFIARPDDPMPYGREIYGRCIRGEFGFITMAPKKRIDKFFRAIKSRERYVIGDLYSDSSDETLNSYIAQHNIENRSGSERGTVIACSSILEHVLQRLLEQEGLNAGARPALSKRIELAYKCGILSAEERAHLMLVRDIRNSFSHEYAAVLTGEPQRSNCEKLYEAVIGDGATPSFRLRYSSACAEIMANLIARFKT
jgi:hypothetical protein